MYFVQEIGQIMGNQEVFEDTDPWSGRIQNVTVERACCSFVLPFCDQLRKVTDVVYQRKGKKRDMQPPKEMVRWVGVTGEH